MKLDKIQIKNIKSIKDTGYVHVMNNNPITILAGQNESGKTSFLKALRYFEEGDYENFEDDDMRLDGIPRVDCVYALTTEELVTLETDTNKRIADYVKVNGFNYLRRFVDEKHSFRYSNPDDFKAIVNEYNLEVEQINENKEEDADDLEEFDPFNYFEKIRPRFVFYSSFLENNLPHSAKKVDLNTNQALIDFQSVYEISFEALMKTSISDQKRRTEEERVNRMAANSLNKYWKQKISEEEVDYKYNIKINFQVEGTPNLRHLF
jgi:predicted ATP-dependent endonuclease of OLD family